MAPTERLARLLAWSIHLFTASGAVLGVFTLVAIAIGRPAFAAILMLICIVIDAVDGTFARAARVAEHVPQIDGRRLDDIVDFLNFVIVPVFFLWGVGKLAHPLWMAAPVLASAYGFSRVDAKTEDDFFLGFPSYWNILALYLWLLGADRVLSTSALALLSIAVFVPIKYLYPSKIESPALRYGLGAGALLWTLALAAAVIWPARSAELFLVELSLAYPIWYLWLSLTRGGLTERAAS